MIETETENNEVIDPEIVREESALTRPSVPVSIDELAVIPDDRGVQVVQARHKIIDTLRRASISLTSPQDWLLFKTNEGAVTAFCQDSGCKRFWQIWGIEITPIGDFEKITDDETGDFAYRCVGNGISKVTGLFVERIEGIRYSTENYCKDLPKLQQVVRVKQAAIANRDGNIIRALTGLKSVAVEMLEEVWKGTGKTTQLCSLGKGFGSRAERMGAAVQQASDLPEGMQPKCPDCGQAMKFVPAGKSARGEYDAFWACHNREHKKTFKHADVLREAQKRQPVQGAA